jgi:hypothetical protein
MTRQSQDVGESGQAIQSGRDTNVHNGLSAEQLKAIISTIAEQLPAYAALAREIVDARLVDFENRIVERFEADPAAKAEAFGDPDFQYLVRNAQHAYARSGEEDVGAMLADLIAERSKSSGRDRLALSLNQAVEVSANLTVNEFSALAFAYLMRRTRQNGVSNIHAMASALNARINPFIDNLTTEESSYSYLVAQRCATISMGEISLRDILVGEYPAFFMRGAPLSDFGPLPADILADRNLFIPALLNPSLFQPRAADKPTWDEMTNRAGLVAALSDQAWSVGQGSLMQESEIISAYAPIVPRIADAFEIWGGTPVKSLELTTVGIAIGHAYAKSSGFDADLRIWIK